MSERFMVKVAVHLFLFRENEILLLRRFNTGFEDGNYSLVAGHIDGGEEITTAMIREAKEEAGIDIKEDDIEIVHVMHRNGEDCERIDYFLSCEKWSGEIKNMEADKCDDLSWFKFDALPENMIEYIKKGLEYYSEGVKFSEFEWDK